MKALLILLALCVSMGVSQALDEKAVEEDSAEVNALLKRLVENLVEKEAFEEEAAQLIKKKEDEDESLEKKIERADKMELVSKGIDNRMKELEDLAERFARSIDEMDEGGDMGKRGSTEVIPSPVAITGCAKGVKDLATAVLGVLREMKEDEIAKLKGWKKDLALWDSRQRIAAFKANPENKVCGQLANRADYRGTQSTTIENQACINWNIAPNKKYRYKAGTVSPTGLGDHNYCRNPSNNKKGLWCYVSTKKRGNWKYCKVDDACLALDYRKIVGKAGCAEKPEDYFGYMDRTKDGETCADWNTLKDQSTTSKRWGYRLYAKNYARAVWRKTPGCYPLKANGKIGGFTAFLDPCGVTD